MSFLIVTIILQNKILAFAFPPYTIPLYSQLFFENLLETVFFLKTCFHSLETSVASHSLPPLSANVTFTKPLRNLHETFTQPSLTLSLTFTKS